ncbi:MAG TPA: hypothetical protein VNK41_08885 [Vicinamibacterales bacterium]|nr:hypothetical protein [Vicinamibacterales bacterium]
MTAPHAAPGDLRRCVRLSLLPILLPIVPTAAQAVFGVQRNGTPWQIALRLSGEKNAALANGAVTGVFMPWRSAPERLPPSIDRALSAAGTIVLITALDPPPSP